MVIKIIRYIIGFVVFRASGGFTERFINLCENANIHLWNIENNKGEIIACTTSRDYKRIREISKSSGMKTACIKKCGLGFFITKNKVRSGLAVGIIAFVLILITLSQFAWRIEVVGNNELDEETILSVFEGYGIKTGAKISELDLKKITENALGDLPDISWATVNKKGSLLCIEVREKRKIPVLYDSNTPTNVIAGEDGLILSIDALCGVKEAKVGSAVRKGDLLISGIVAHRDGAEELLHADGRIRARVNDDFTVSLSELDLAPLKSYKKHYDIFFFGFSVPIGSEPYGDIVTRNSSYLKSGDAVLPVGIIKTTGIAFSDEQTPSDDMGRLICTFKCAEHINILLNTAEVKESKFSFPQTNSGFSCRVYSICEKDIAELQEIYTEKTSDK